MDCCFPLSLNAFAWLCELVMSISSHCSSAQQAKLTLSFSNLFICQHFSPSNDVASERAVVSHPDEIRQLAIL